MKTVSLLVLLLVSTPAFAGDNKNQGNKWETVYQWCANAAPEYLEPSILLPRC
jgi:hypothetical protein